MVPCGSYDCMTARDTLHTLRSTDEGFSIQGTKYAADFTGANELVGGNLNDDEFIDIIDFALFNSQFGQDVGASDCDTSPTHADISGNGLVGVEDYTFIQINFLLTAEANCCGLPSMAGVANGPTLDISVDELWARGMGHLTVADLNVAGMAQRTQALP